MAQPGFIFGGNTGISYDELQNRRKVLSAMMARQSAPQNTGEGIFALTQGLVNGWEGRQLDRQAADAEASAASDFGAAVRSMYPQASGQLASPIEPVAAPSVSAASAPLPSGERAAYIRSGLISRGLPEHVADGFMANFQDESGLDPGINEQNPTVPGSRGGFGLYQLTGPRRTAYEAYAGQRGVDPSDVDAQLDFMMTELGGPEKRAADRIMASQDTAGAAQSILNDFLRPAPEHRRERGARYASLGGAPQPVQVASLDPSAGMGAAPSPVETVAAAMPTATGQKAPRESVQRVAQAMPQQATGGMEEAMIRAMTNPAMPSGQRQVLGALLQRQQAQQQAAAEAQRERAVLLEQRQYEGQVRREGYQREDSRNQTLDGRADREFVYKVEQGAKPPTSIQEYEYARAQGFAGTFADYEQANRKAGATNVNLSGQPNIGTIPQGYQAIKDEQTGQWRMSRIPGGPEDDAKANAKKADNQEISTGIVTTAAARAREALNAAGLPATGSVGGVLAALPESNAAELRRQVSVLQANAKVENLTAMRAASPTGAALGAVSDSENAMLAAKSGTLDPSSPNFARDLDDYERTLLRIVHGPKVGDAIYEQTRGGSAAGPAVAERRPNLALGSDAGQRYEGGVPVGGMSQAGTSAPAPVQIKSPEEFNALPPGALFIAPDGTTRRKPNG